MNASERGMKVQYVFLQVPQYGKMFGLCFHQLQFTNILLTFL